MISVLQVLQVLVHSLALVSETGLLQPSEAGAVVDVPKNGIPSVAEK